MEEKDIADSKNYETQIQNLKIYEEKKNVRCRNLKDLINKCPELQNKVEIGLFCIEPIDVQKNTINNFQTNFKQY